MPNPKSGGKPQKRRGAQSSSTATYSTKTVLTPEQRFINLLFDQHRHMDLPPGTYIKTENATRARFYFRPLKIEALPQADKYELGAIFITFIKDTLWAALCIDNEKIISDLFEMRASLFIDTIKPVYLAIEHHDMKSDFYAKLKENMICILRDSFDREAITTNFMLYNLTSAKLGCASIVGIDLHIAEARYAFYQIMRLMEIKDICYVIDLLHQRGRITTDDYRDMMRDLGRVDFNTIYATFKDLYPTEEPLALNRTQKLAIQIKYDTLWADFRQRYRDETQVKWLEDLKHQYKTLIGLIIVAVSLAVYAPMLWVGLSVLIIVAAAVGHKRFERVISTQAQQMLADEYRGLQSVDERKRRVGQMPILPDAVLQYEGPAWRKGLLYHKMMQATYRWMSVDVSPADMSGPAVSTFPEVRLMSHAEYLQKLAELPKAPSAIPRRKRLKLSPLTTATIGPSSVTASSSSGSQRPTPTLSDWQAQGVFCHDPYSQSMAFFKFSERMPTKDRRTIEQHCVNGYGDFIAKKGEFDGFKWQEKAYKFKPSNSQARIHFSKSEVMVEVKTERGVRNVPVWEYQRTVAKHQ